MVEQGGWGPYLIFILIMERETKNKVIAINEAIAEELDSLTREVEFRVENITKLKNEILKQIK